MMTLSDLMEAAWLSITNKSESYAGYRFYRAMLYIARTVLSQDICLSVRLSVRPSHAGIA